MTIKMNRASGDLWVTIQGTNVCIMGGPEGEEQKKEAGRIYKEIMGENFSSLVKNINLHIEEIPYTPNPK